jgi:hypothetical protein
MSIQYGPGPVAIAPDDVQITHRGMSVALKLREISAGFQVLMLHTKTSGDWDGGRELIGFDDGTFSVQALAADLARFIREVLRRVNDILAQLFTPQGEQTDMEKLDAALRGLRFVPQPDGTLKLVQ